MVRKSWQSIGPESSTPRFSRGGNLAIKVRLLAHRELPEEALRGAKYEKRYGGRDKDRQSHQLTFCESVKINRAHRKETKTTVCIKERLIGLIFARR